jgi:FkbM family methyltransferase
MHASAPLDIPVRDAYQLVGEDNVTSHLARVMTLIRPDAKISTASSPDDIAADVFPVLCGQDWASDRDALRKKGVDVQGYATLPVPIGDPWSWWEFSRANIDHLGFGDEVIMGRHEFEQYLLNEADRATINDDGEMVLFSSCYFIYNQDRVEENAAKIRTVVEAFSDEQSRQTYLKVLMKTPEYSWEHYLSRTFRSVQYFDYVNYQACKSVLNGGVWLGFEIPLLMSALPNDAIVHNIDPLGFDYLTPYARKTVDHFSDRCLEQRVALDDHTGKTSFPVMPDGQASPQYGLSDMTAVEESEFDCTTIDRFVAEHEFQRHGLIKLDLEGGEVNALSLMGATIEVYRPQLAISIYHDFHHFWDMPLALMSVCKDYNFYFEIYSWERWEGIFYGIPKEIDLRHNQSAANG